MLIEELPAANDLPLAEHLAALRPCQLVLVEGFKHEAWAGQDRKYLILPCRARRFI